MKAYKLIFQLLKHPTAEVKMLRNEFEITDICYNRYFKEFTLWSMTSNKTKDE